MEAKEIACMTASQLGNDPSPASLVTSLARILELSDYDPSEVASICAHHSRCPAYRVESALDGIMAAIRNESRLHQTLLRHELNFHRTPEA